VTEMKDRSTKSLSQNPSVRGFGIGSKEEGATDGQGTLRGRVSPAAALVELLRKAATSLSGTDMGRRMGISRAAVWKHVSRLRRDGYRIEGTPSQGYRLMETPDVLTPAELGGQLTSKLLGRVLHYENEVDSTNRLARELAQAGAAEGTVVIADAQTAGRGRLGRSWFSPRGLNLYLSVVLRPAIPPARAPQLALVAASAVVASVREVAGVRVAIKWPNDILFRGRKVAGILTEMSSEADQVSFAIVGIGVNVNVSARVLDRELSGIATSLAAAAGRPINRAAFTVRLLAELEQRYCRYLQEGFGPLREEWESHSCLTGHEVTVEGPGGRRRGRVVGIDEEGALCLRGPGGKALLVLAGDVTLSKTRRQTLGSLRSTRRRDRHGGR